MSRAPIESRPSTAQWLIAAREAAGFTNAPDFLAAVKEAEGKAPSYSTYAQWESGSVTPRRSSLKVIERYHAAHGAETSKAPAPAPDLATALLALVTELGALREERTTLARQVEQLQATVALLAERVLDPAETPAPAALDARAGTAG